MRTRNDDRALFRRVVEESRLPIAIFAEWVMGVDRTTGNRYLHGGEIPASKKLWLRHVESVTHSGDQITVVLKWRPPNPRWWPYVEKEPGTYMAEERGLNRPDYRRRG